MKKLTTLILILLCAVSLFAQAPEKFTYQAVVRNASNVLVTNTLVGVRVRILQGSATGSGVYVETQMPSTNANGLITLNIGDGNAIFGTFGSIDWSAGPYFLKTEIDPTGGSNYSVTSTQQLLSVPYALYAKAAGNGFSGDYNDLTNTPAIPTVPTNVSAFTNDAGYITGYTETDPTVPAWAKEANKPTYNYSEIVNTPTIPTVPTNVSAFTNDAGYLTGYTETDPTVPAWAKEANKPTYNYSEIVNTPTIPTVPTNVSAFTNDAGYLTNYTETDPTVPAWAKEANKPTYNYSEIVNTPTIPTVPTNVSAFTNDAGYITGYTETDPQFNAWDKNYNDLTNKPVLFDGDYNSLSNKPVLFDGDYNSLTNQPTIPTVPANVSAFANDAGYITGYTETDPTISAWAKEANKPTYDYTEITNTPVIPTVPTYVSAFANDAQYITAEAIPTQVSAFNNDAEYITVEAIPTQVSAFNNDAEYITVEAIPTQVSAFNNDAEYITSEAIPTQVSAFNNDAEYITIAAVPTQVSAFENDAQYVTESELQLTVNVINNTFDSVDNVMNDMDNTIDSLRSRIEELEGTHTPPTVMTTGAANVTYRAAVVNGSIVHVGASPVTARGFCYDTVMHPTVNGNLVNCGSGAGDFSTNLLNIAPNTTYYVRAYATNIWGTNYGNELTFTTLTEHTPSVEILPASEISYTSFVCSGDVTDSGTYAVTARGFCWSTEPDPVMTGEHLHVGNGAGTFSATLADIQPETTYYVRAYAVNAVGVTYSTPITVTTLTPTIPTVTTDNVSTHNRCTGTVVDDGHAPVTQRGFVYDTLPNPTLSNGVVIAEGDGLGGFSELLTGLSIGRLYFVRAFATNARGTGYGDQLYFTAESDSMTVTDYDGNVYNTVTIGTQIWMKENLKTTHYSDGWPIEFGLNISSKDVAYYYYPGNNVSNVEMYGLLYNGAAVMNGASFSGTNPSGVQGICPTGWHVPSAAEWNQLRDYVKSHSMYACGSSSSQTAKALADSIGWYISSGYNSCSPGNDPSSNNATGFSARQAGSMISGVASGVASNDGGALFWCTTKANSSGDNLFYVGIPNPSSASFNWPGGNGLPKTYGFSVRCLRDY